MNNQERALMAEAAVASKNALERQQGMFGFETIRLDRFSSNSYQNWADWSKHFAWVADGNWWEDKQARMVLPTCLTGWALEKILKHAGPLQKGSRRLTRPPFRGNAERTRPANEVIPDTGRRQGRVQIPDAE